MRPFSVAELEVRVARATQTSSASTTTTIVRVGSLELNLATYQVTIDGRAVDFTYMEYELLKFLMTHPNRVFSREALLKRVWGYDYYGGARTVDVHIRRVRAKLGQEQACADQDGAQRRLPLRAAAARPVRRLRPLTERHTLFTLRPHRRNRARLSSLVWSRSSQVTPHSPLDQPAPASP